MSRKAAVPDVKLDGEYVLSEINGFRDAFGFREPDIIEQIEKLDNMFGTLFFAVCRVDNNDPNHDIVDFAWRGIADEWPRRKTLMFLLACRTQKSN